MNDVYKTSRFAKTTEQNNLEKLYSKYKSGKYDEALNQGKKLLIQFPNNPNIPNILGAVYAKLRKFNEAKLHFKMAIKIDHQVPHGYQNLAALLSQIGESRDSHKNRLCAVLISPSQISNYKHLVNYFVKDKNTQKALQLLKQKPLFTINSKFFLWYMGIVSYQFRDYASANKYYDQSLALGSDNAELYINRGLSSIGLGLKLEAHQFFKKSVLLSPGLSATYQNTAKSARGMLPKRMIERLFDFALILAPASTETLNDKGWFFNESYDFQSARNTLKKALILEPTNKQAFANITIFLQYMSERACSKNMIKKFDFLKNAVSKPSDTFSVFTLMPFGRAGSLWFHSLLDGHSEIATLPGAYFQGWFSDEAEKYFKPDYTDRRWRTHLVKKIVDHYEPLFDARSKKNVFGLPFGTSDWLAKDSGFTNMGEKADDYFYADSNAFSEWLFFYLNEYDSIDHGGLFELINWAFTSLRKETANFDKKTKKHLFYHAHNPSTLNLLNIFQRYPKLKSLILIRDPIQGLESWLIQHAASWMEKKEYIEQEMKSAVSISSERKYKLDQETKLLINEKWSETLEPIRFMFDVLYQPCPPLGYNTGIRLEDLKRSATTTMQSLANLLGIEHQQVMYESKFFGQIYWGVASISSGRVGGFDEKPLAHKKGRVLGQRDLLILETLFWPITSVFGYTKTTRSEFMQNMKRIKPLIHKPLEFEKNMFGFLMQAQIDYREVPGSVRIHNLLERCWLTLNENGSYPNTILPLSSKSALD